MNSYVTSYQKAAGDTFNSVAVPEEFATEYPVLAELFRGVPSKEQGVEAIPPATLSVFFEGGRLKFCIHPKTGYKIAFGSVEDASKGLLGIEVAIQKGHFEWKRSSGRRTS